MAFLKKKDADDSKKQASTKRTASGAADKTKKSGITSLTKSAEYILRGPRITEKSAYATVQGAYVFMVAMDATKRDIVAAIKHVYNVTPVKVNIVRIAPRPFVSPQRRRRGVQKGYKKAYVFLKKGDKIDMA